MYLDLDLKKVKDNQGKRWTERQKETGKVSTFRKKSQVLSAKVNTDGE